MLFKVIRFRKEYRLKGRVFLLTILIIFLIILPQPNRALMASFFSNRCRNAQSVYSKKLNDMIINYSSSAKMTGIEKCANIRDLRKRVLTGKLLRIRSTKHYKIEEMKHSHPYLTRESKKLLKEIGRRFRRKIETEGLKGSRFIITSMTRTTENLNSLGRSNINASDDSPHLYGNAFDISYARFSFLKFRIMECDRWYMKEALAEVIFQLRREKKCWATYERQQGCFHVVSR